MIGRWDSEQASFPEIDLEDLDEEVKISRKHAIIIRKGAEATLEDIGSRNGTYVGEERLEPGEKRQLQDGDELVIGKTVLVFEKGESSR